MSSSSSGKKGLSRRSLLSIAGGAAGLLTAKKIVGGNAPVVVPPVPEPVAPAAPPIVEAKAETPALRSFGSSGTQTITAPPVSELPEAGQHVRDLLGPLAVGSRIYGWTVVAIHDVHLGAIPVVLKDANGDQFQVDICRKDPSGPRAVAETARFSLFLSNMGNGRTPSNESHGLGVIALATVISRNERRGVPAGLMTLRERTRRYPNGSYAAPA